MHLALGVMSADISLGMAPAGAFLMGGSMSERVRQARALDAIERIVDKCCEMAVKSVRESKHIQNELTYVIFGAVNEAAVIYDVEIDWLARESMRMLHDKLQRFLRPLGEVRYVKPYKDDERVVGMQAKVYRIWG